MVNCNIGSNLLDFTKTSNKFQIILNEPSQNNYKLLSLHFQQSNTLKLLIKYFSYQILNQFLVLPLLRIMFELTQTKRPSSSRHIEARSKSFSDLSKNNPKYDESISSNHLYGFGRNRQSQFPSSSIPNILALASGQKHTVYLNSDNQCGQLGVSLPYTSIPIQVMKDKMISSVFCGPYSTFLLTCKGQLYATGKNTKGQLGVCNYTDQSTFVLVQQLSRKKNSRARVKTIIGSSSTVLTERQTIDNIIKDQTPQKKKFFEVSSNQNNICLLQQNELVKQISCGPFHSLLLTNTGRLFTSGLLINSISSQQEYSNEFIQLKYRLGRIQHISSGLVLNGVLTSEGRVYIWGIMNEKYISQPTQIDIKNITNLSLGGSSFNFVVNSRGEVYQIFDFEQQKYFRMKKIQNLPSIKSISSGSQHAIALTQNRCIYGWGNNKYNQVSDADKSMLQHFQSPVLISHIGLVHKVVCGSYHTLVLTSQPILSAQIKSNKSQSIEAIADQCENTTKRKETKQSKTQTQTMSKFQIPNINPRTFNTSLEIPFEQLVLQKQISEGGYGIIYKGKWRETTVAVKIFKIDQSEVGVKDFLSQCHAMQVMRHPNIVMFLGACTKPPHYAIVLQYCSKGTLWSILHSSIDLSWEDKRRFALDTAKGMHYLHSFEVPILHRDLKSLNLLIDESYRVKLADFGWTKGLQNYMTGKIGTYQWMAPEVISGQKYTQKADIFSFGIILWEIASREPPYRNVSGLQVSIQVVNNQLRPPIPKKCPEPFAKLMKKCWDRRAQSRPSFREIIKQLQCMKLSQ